MAMHHPYEINYTIEDAKKRTANLVVYIQREDKYDSEWNFDGVNDPEQFALFLGKAIEGIIAGRVKRISITTVITPADFPFPTTTFKPIADVNSDVEEGVKVFFQTADGHIFSHRIPSIDEIYLNDDGTLNDQATPVALYLTYMTVPSNLVDGWTIQPVDNRNEELRDWLWTAEAFDVSRANKR